MVNITWNQDGTYENDYDFLNGKISFSINTVNGSITDWKLGFTSYINNITGDDPTTMDSPEGFEFPLKV